MLAVDTGPCITFITGGDLSLLQYALLHFNEKMIPPLYEYCR